MSPESGTFSVHSAAPLVRAHAATQRSSSRSRARGTNRYSSSAVRAASRGPNGRASAAGSSAS